MAPRRSPADVLAKSVRVKASSKPDPVWTTRLRSERGSRGLTLSIVATELRLPLSTYQKIEAGYCDPPLSVALAIADFYGKEVTDLWLCTPQ